MGTVHYCHLFRYFNKKMKAIIAIFLCGLAMASALPASKQRSIPMTYRQALKAKTIQCDICTFIVTEIDHILVTDEVTDALIQQVEALCASLDNVFPGAGASCNAIVETYLPQIIEGLVNNQLSPAAVCQALTLCSAFKKILKDLNRKFSW